MRVFLSLKAFFFENLSRYVIGIVFLVIVDFLQLITPKILGKFADAFQYRQLNAEALWYYGGIIVITAAGIAVFRYIWRLQLNSTARRLEFWLRNKLYNHFLQLDAGYYDRHRVGDLMAHATNDVHAVRMSLSLGIVMLIDSVIITAASVIIMLTTIDARLTLLALLPLPLMALTAAYFGQMVHRRFRDVQEAFSQITEKVQENIAGIRVIKSFVRESSEIKKFKQASYNYVNKNMSLAKISGVFNPLVQFLSAVSFVLILDLGGTAVIRGTISLGDFVAFNSYLGMLTWPMRALGQVVNVMQRGAASLDRINAILATKPEITDAEKEMNFSFRGKVEFRELNFSYRTGHEAALQDFSFSLYPGQTLGIVGRTGSGKTTIASLLLHLYEPPPGKIFLDGIDILDIPLMELRGQVGLVPQDTFLFSTSIRDNISFGGPFTSEEIEEAAEKALLSKDLTEMPQGLETMVGERGITLSGGQKQRVAIARALLHNPALLILDDSLSAVDTETEKAILANIKKLRRHKSTIIIAHRLSTLQHADQILVLKDGQLTEKGSHLELLASGKTYASLWEKQQLEAEISKED